MDDQSTPAAPVAEMPAQAPEPAPTPVEPESSQPNGSTPTDLPPEAPESSIGVPAPIPVESQNGGVNQPESEVSEASIPGHVQVSVPASAPAALTPQAPQPQSPAQPDQTGFIRALLAKAQAKIQSNKQKKLDKIIMFGQKKKTIANEDVQKLLHVSSATATRYLVKLVQQGRLSRVGNPRDAKYQFVR
jgi:hypothetical protein